MKDNLRYQEHRRDRPPPYATLFTLPTRIYSSKPHRKISSKSQLSAVCRWLRCFYPNHIDSIINRILANPAAYHRMTPYDRAVKALSEILSEDSYVKGIREAK